MIKPFYKVSYYVFYVCIAAILVIPKIRKQSQWQSQLQ